jgi:hypothetical protein
MSEQEPAVVLLIKRDSEIGRAMMETALDKPKPTAQTRQEWLTKILAAPKMQGPTGRVE